MKASSIGVISATWRNKRVRELTGMGLKEAKDYVESL